MKATQKQTQAIRNLMLNRSQIALVDDCLRHTGNQWLKDLSIGDAKSLIDELIRGVKGR